MEAGKKMQCKCKADVYEELKTHKELLRQANHTIEQFQWIDVNDTLPGDNRVLAYTPNDDQAMEYRFIPAGLFKQVASEATHWIPLPKPPTN